MRRAAEQGDTDAQFWLGVGYEQDWFGTVDVHEGLAWYRKAAEGGNPDAREWKEQHRPSPELEAALRILETTPQD